MGVEPTLSAWKADVLAIILMVHLCAAQPARAEVYLLEFRLFNL